MTQGTMRTTVELVINGHACEHEVTVTYEYSRAGGDGWHEPRYSEGASLYSVETRGQSAPSDLLPLLSKEVIAGLEADCCQHEAEGREYLAGEAADHRRQERLEEARSDLADAIAEREQME